MTADMQNSDGYLSLMVSLQGRMIFIENVYSWQVFQAWITTSFLVRNIKEK